MALQVIARVYSVSLMVDLWPVFVLVLGLSKISDMYSYHVKYMHFVHLHAVKAGQVESTMDHVVVSLCIGLIMFEVFMEVYFGANRR